MNQVIQFDMNYWWLKNPSEKYMKVSWDDEIPS